MSNIIPTTLFTGSLGAGKTTVIMNLIKQLPKEYSVVWLKNEYGDVNVDSELAKLQNIQTQEVLNGCICCVLIGRLEDALKEVIEKYSPDRLIIETAGSAYPYPIIQRINSLQTLKVDGVVNVVDALNYKSFIDDDYLTKQQAEFVDLVVINKLKLVDEQNAYEVEEYVRGIYTKSQIVLSRDGFVEQGLLIGIDSKLAQKARGLTSTGKHSNHTKHIHHPDEVEVFSFTFKVNSLINLHKLEELLNALSPKKYYRIKGLVNTKSKSYLINYVLGRLDIQALESYKGDSKLTFMGKRILDQKDAIIIKLEQMYE